MPHSVEPWARLPKFFLVLGGRFIIGMEALPGWEMSRGEGRGRDHKTGKKEPAAEKWAWSREAEGLSHPEVKAASRWPQRLAGPHLLSLAYASRGRVIRRNSLLGKRGAGVCCVLILGLRSSEGPGELQGGEGKAVL